MSCRNKKLAVLAVLALLLTSCQSVFGRSETEESATPTPIPTPIVPEKPSYLVQQGKVVKQLEFTGRVSPVEEISLYFKSNGYVKEVFIERGDPVKVGDKLAELEIDDLLRQMAQGEVSLNSVRLRLEEAEKGLERQIAQADMNLAAAQARLTAAQEANADAIMQAELALAVAQQQLARLQARQADTNAEVLSANINLTRAQDALDSARIEYQEALERPWEREEVVDAYAGALQDAEWNHDLAQARYSQALAGQQGYQHDYKIQELAIAQAEANLEQLQRGVDPLVLIEVQRAQQQRDWLQEGVDPVLVNEVNQAELALERLQAQVADAQITAPIEGEVLSQSIFAGRPAEAFKPVVVVADPSNLEISADLTSEQLQELIEGQVATVSLSSVPGETWAGTVRQLPYPYGTGGSSQDVIDADTSVRIGLEGELSELELGDLARVLIILEEKDNVLWLPPQAIRNFQGRNFVIVQDADRQRRVDVRVGIESQERVEILEGLEAGQTIVGQ